MKITKSILIALTAFAVSSLMAGSVMGQGQHLGKQTGGTKQTRTLSGQANPRRVLQPPSVEKLASGDYALKLTPPQQEVVDEFLRHHPGLRLTHFDDIGGNREEVIPHMQAADRYLNMPKWQFPYACWADLNRDGFLDVALVFVSKKPVNSWGWREWWIVVFQGSPDESFRPTIVTKEQNGCLAGMYSSQKRNTVEYVCFPSGVGSFRWNGKRYVVVPLRGH